MDTWTKRRDTARQQFVDNLSKLGSKIGRADLMLEIKPMENFINESEKLVSDARSECNKLNADLVKKQQSGKRNERNC